MAWRVGPTEGHSDVRDFWLSAMPWCLLTVPAPAVSFCLRARGGLCSLCARACCALLLYVTCHVWSLPGPRWNYEACFFDKATQWEGYQGRTTIGHWKGFEKGYTEAVFDNGDPCGTFPNRQARGQGTACFAHRGEATLRPHVQPFNQHHNVIMNKQ